MNIMDLYQPKHCTNCGKVISDRSRVMLCINCNNNLRLKANRIRYEAQGLCGYCGRETDGVYKECLTCRMKRRQYRKRRCADD